MMMRKDYEMLIGVIKITTYQCQTDAERAIVRRLAAKLATELYANNMRFDANQFMAACGFPPTVRGEF